MHKNSEEMNQYRSSFWGAIPPVVKNLVIINLLFWLASVTLAQTKGIHLNDWLGLHYWEASKFNPFQLISYMFLHGFFPYGSLESSFSHLFFNMFGLYMFGSILEYKWGSKRFLIYYIVTGIGAGIIQQVVWTIELYPAAKEIAEIAASGLQHGVNVGEDHIIYSADELFKWKNEVFFNYFTTVGASGAIFGLLLAFGMLFPDQSIYVMFIPIPVKAKYLIIGYAVIELFFGVADFQFDNIAHFAHLGGMLFGYFLVRKWKREANNRMFNR